MEARKISCPQKAQKAMATSSTRPMFSRLFTLCFNHKRSLVLMEILSSLGWNKSFSIVVIYLLLGWVLKPVLTLNHCVS